jgi:hypothetical protein
MSPVGSHKTLVPIGLAPCHRSSPFFYSQAQFANRALSERLAAKEHREHKDDFFVFLPISAFCFPLSRFSIL